MSMLGLALVATLSVAPEDEAFVVTPAPAAEAAPAPAASVEVTVAPPVAPPPAVAPAPVVVVTPAPAPAPAPPMAPPVRFEAPRKPLGGFGLLAASSTIFIIGLSAQISTAAAQANYCTNWERNGFNTAHGCFYVTEPWHAHAGTGYAFGSAMVMTSIGASALGKYDAWHSVYGDGRTRNARARVGAGVALVGLSIGAFVAEAFMLRREFDDFCTTVECEVDRRKLYYGLADAGALGMSAGFGLIAHGNSYRRHLARYGKFSQWSLSPQASPTSVGMGASLRF
ncbi:hypothetical protein G6O69_13740 [Pseudenhygromyxa sp. WMMC2535]|uniref:hypothetical protein n=1 Tax=Pseudenhygromyxa sp. WMMC2535 TaxID=2712867 RepID=UPI001595CB05|nr:hypothetical protein [Pseudenhygromyxa sp. WMMC2535]NVB38899.1 hypothetical protein [Pseudenhygromyxa sp. WMMC2535]